MSLAKSPSRDLFTQLICDITYVLARTVINYLVGVLRMRKEPLEKIIEANTSATNLVMHKDSMWNHQWESFKNSRMGERKLHKR